LLLRLGSGGLLRLLLSLHLPVLGKAAGIIRDGAIRQLPDPGGEAVDEVPVMADKQQRAVVGLHRLLDPLPGVDVQMVGGLVQDQEVDLVIHQHAQPQAALLPAGEHRHRLEHVLAPEVVCRQPVSGRLGREALFRR
ncbi:Ribonuclease Z, partial [Dysosmobacter welbionis]